jgi:hypothetical protein
MQNLFCGYYRPNENKFREIWQTATFVLDANILLNMYRYPEEARKQLLNVLQSIEARLWVPYQAALEFQRNRVAVIAEQKKRFSDVRKVLESSRDGMRSELENLQLKKRHSSIQPDKLITSIDSQISNFLLKLQELEASQLSVTDHDPVRENLDRLLKGKVGEPFAQDEIIKIYQEGEERFKHEIPPGYKDKKKDTGNKSDVFSYSGITYQRKYGDLVLWKQIICKAKKDSVKSLIFLTDDEKEDWWWITDFQGKKKMGPRPELVDEISREAKTEFFYIYNSEQFLKYSKNYLNTQVTDESISQVREVTRESRMSNIQRHREFRRLTSIAARAVLRWLDKKYPGNKMIRENDSFPDYVVSDPESGKNLGFEVKISREPRTLSMMLRDQIYRAYYEVNEGYLDELTFILVMQDQDRETLDRAISIFERRIERFPAGVNLILGIINMEIDDELEADFYPVFEFTGAA